MPTISIIVPIYNEQRYISSCIESILESDYDKSKMEVLFVDGKSSDDTIKIINKYAKCYDFIKLLNNHKKIVSSAMNIGIKSAKGEYIIRLDAHSTYPKDYFTKLIKYHKKLEADNIGGVIKSDVKNKTPISIAIKNVLSDKLGVGSSFRVGVDSIKEVDTVPFGCYKKEIFEKIGLYDERLVRNQDIELNKRLKRVGGKIYLVPDIKATYFARESFKSFVKNSFENGKWNILTAYYTKTLKSLSLRHYIPLLFLLILFITFFCCYKVLIIIFFIYFLIISLRSAIISKDTNILYQIVAFILLHFSYGVGELMGILKVLKIGFKGSFS